MKSKSNKILFLTHYKNKGIIKIVQKNKNFVLGNINNLIYKLDKDKFNLGIIINNKYTNIKKFKNIFCFDKLESLALLLEKAKENNINLINKNFHLSENNILVHNKIGQHLFFKKNNIPCLPITNDFNNEKIDKYIFKYNRGSFGKEIFLPEEERSFLQEKIKSNDFFMEKLIRNKKEYRVLTINKKSILTTRIMNRNSPTDNINLNIEKIQYSKIENIAEKISNILDLDYCGIDFVLDCSSNKIYVLEINFFAKLASRFPEYTREALDGIKKYFDSLS